MKKKNTLIVIASCPPLPCLSPELMILHSSASQGYKQHGKTLGMDLYLKKKNCIYYGMFKHTETI